MKTLGWIIGVLVLLAVGVFAYIALNSGNLVKTAIEEFGPDYLGADVAVSEVNLVLSEGTAQVKGLNIGNPAGFGDNPLMQLGEIKVVLDTSALSGDVIVMKQVLIDGADIAGVAQGKNTNFQQLMDNLDAATGGPAESSDTGASETLFIIDRFDFTNAKASLTSDVIGEHAFNLPDIALSDIGRKTDGATASELAQQLFKPIFGAISKQAVSQGIDLDGVRENVEGQIRDKIDGGLRGLTDRFKK